MCQYSNSCSVFTAAGEYVARKIRQLFSRSGKNDEDHTGKKSASCGGSFSNNTTYSSIPDDDAQQSRDKSWENGLEERSECSLKARNTVGGCTKSS